MIAIQSKKIREIDLYFLINKKKNKTLKMDMNGWLGKKKKGENEKIRKKWKEERRRKGQKWIWI